MAETTPTIEVKPAPPPPTTEPEAGGNVAQTIDMSLKADDEPRTTLEKITNAGKGVIPALMVIAMLSQLAASAMQDESSSRGH